MKISKKDISFILLIISSLIVIWAIYSAFSSLYFAARFKSNDLGKLIVKEDNTNKWLNLSGEIKISDLKNRVILLDFWTYDCVNCLQVNSKIKELEQEFGSKLTVIGVHCSRFNDALDVKEIRKAIIKHDIDYPVINDQNHAVCNNFKSDSIENIELPTVIIIDPYGKINKRYIGRKDINTHLKKDLKKIISKYNYQLNRESLPILLEKNIITGHILSFPTKIEYASDFEYNGVKMPVIFIVNSGKNNIIISSLAGEIIAKIGSKNQGFDDGDFESASFNFPNGMAYKDHKLYVADTNNDAIRVVDFKENKVSTLIAGEISCEDKNVNLSSPADLKFYPDSDDMIIASAGNNQILQYNLKNQTTKVIAGNSSDGMEDGKYPQNSLSQTAALAIWGQKIYFIDAKSSSLRVIDKNGEVSTLIGQGILKFGDQNGDKSQALMHHPSGLTIDDTGIYIADSYNNSIKKYDFLSRKISNFAGSKPGDDIGSKEKTKFDNPGAIISVLDKFYVADSNNDRIVIINRGNFKTSILNVMPPLKLPKEGLLEYLPNLQKLKNLKVSAKEPASLKINLPNNYHINESAPSFINLLELTKQDQANLMANFDWNVIKNLEIKLPILDAKKDYILQGAIYYCSNKANSLCYISSYEQKIKALNSEKNNVININLSDEQNAK
jgi:thiol-disulfide isomerase/thioredoxin